LQELHRQIFQNPPLEQIDHENVAIINHLENIILHIKEYNIFKERKQTNVKFVLYPRTPGLKPAYGQNAQAHFNSYLDKNGMILRIMRSPNARKKFSIYWFPASRISKLPRRFFSAPSQLPPT